MAEEKIKLAVCYCRVSTSKQEEQGLSLDAQEDYLRSWAVDNPYDIVKVFKVHESASNPERKHLWQTFQYCINNNIKHILITDSDRWTRSRELDTKAQKVIKEHDLEVHIVRDRKVIGKFGTAAEKLMHNIKVDVDEYASDILREKVIFGLKQKLEQNHYPASAPTGYKNVPKSKGNPVAQIVPDHVMFPRVKKFLLKHLTGKYSVDAMVQVAKELGVKSVNGKDLDDGGVRYLLHSKFYHGEFDYSLGGELKTYKNETPGYVPMITKRQWQKNQDILKKRLNRVDTRNGTIDWKFKEMVHCSNCGRFLIGERAVVKYKTKSGMKRFDRTYYHCSGGHYFTDSKGSRVDKERVKQDEFGTYYFETERGHKIDVERQKCSLNGIQEAELEEHLLWEFGALKFSKRQWNKVKTSILKSPQRDEIRLQIQSLRAEYAKNETRLDVMYDDKIEGKISEDYWLSRKEKLEERQSQIEIKLDELEELKKFYDVKVKQSILALDVLNDFGEKFKSADSKTRKKMTQLMVRNIFLTGGGKDSAGYKIPYDLYVEWNDDFTELYELGLVEISKELDEKYKLSGGISNSKNRLAALRSQ
jgi:DNA invertase Pin-like site-specific DNA recombinase